MVRILVVEDEPALRQALVINLRARHYEVEAVGDGASALRAASAHPPQLVIVDLGLPDIDGVDVIAGLRGWTTMPIIVLSARDHQFAKVDALDAGADDYVTKPFGMDELMARIRAALRRADTATSVGDPVVRTDSFVLDLAAKKATRDGREVRLTPTEWHLVEAVARRPGVLVPALTLLAEVLGAAVRKGDQLPTRLLRSDQAQARGGPRQPPPLHHGTRARLQVRALTRASRSRPVLRRACPTRGRRPSRPPRPAHRRGPSRHAPAGAGSRHPRRSRVRCRRPSARTAGRR